MSGLVQRLRDFECSDAIGDGDFTTCREAADEIERLEAELHAGTEAGWHALRWERDNLKAESPHCAIGFRLLACMTIENTAT